MVMIDRSSLTELIHRAQEGDASAADALFAATYDDLRETGRGRLYARQERHSRHSSLVHESYLRFAAAGRLRLQDRVHFMRWAGRVMRSVIGDLPVAARRRRGGDAKRITLTERSSRKCVREEILQVHDPLNTLPAGRPVADR